MRTIHLDAMEETRNEELHVQFVIIGIEHDDLETSINDKTKAAITIQPLNLLYNTNMSSNWANCTIRTWCNDTFINALPSSIYDLIKIVNKQTCTGYGNTTLSTTADKAFLLSETEVFEANKNAVGAEGTQYEYYKTSSNRVKGSAWWLRSPSSLSNGYFCTAGAEGNYNASLGKHNRFLVCPALCL